MTRTEKYKELRMAIDTENKNFRIEHPLKWVWIALNQKLIKKIGGYKH